MRIDQTFLRDLVAMKDEAGVLSLYTTIDPREESSPRPAWSIRLRNELAGLREQVAAWPDRERRAAVLGRIDALEPEILELADGAESGVGRALFAAVQGDDVRKIAMQIPVEDCVVLESTAYIRPLVTALAASPPAGVVIVSRDGLRLIDLRYGSAEDLEEVEFDLDTSDWRPMRGPGPGGSQSDATQVERFEARIEDNYKRWLHAVAPEIPRQAAAKGWSDLLLIGDPRLTELLAPILRPLESTQLDTLIEGLSASEVARHVADELAAIRERRDTDLVTRVIDAAKSGGKGSLGLNQTLALLNEGRVEQLLLDESGRWSGARGTADGYLFDQSPQELETVPEPDLGERMIEAALDSGATVTILGAEAAAPLDDCDGVGALLRW